MGDPEKRKRSLNAEIANGRLAMMAIIGMMYQDGFTGSAWGDWANYTDSPLRAYENELGVQAPVGFWDPVGYSKDGSEEDFRRRRCSEIKHGRISMIAAMGYITPEFTKFPGYLAPHLGLKFSDVPNGLAALSKVPNAGWGQMVFFAGLLETGFFVQEDGRDPGDFANAGTLGVPNAGAPMEDAENRKRKLNSELANGRLAMMAIIGMFFQDGLTGSAWGDWALYTTSPMRAFESELGVQAPVGFWDPLGYTKDGDEVLFKRRRSVEIKHGRVAMLATMGYITPEIAGKWPGYCATDLKFAEIPNGLAALKVVPLVGWVQMVAYCYAIEASADWGEDSRSGTPGDMGWKPPFLANGFVLADEELRKKKLSAELANGRLAMMAIIGMFFQDGLTGSAWGDWALY